MNHLDVDSQRSMSMVLDINDPRCDVEFLFTRFCKFMRLRPPTRRFCFDDFFVWLRYELSLPQNEYLDHEPTNAEVLPIIEAWVSCGLVRVDAGGRNVYKYWWDVMAYEIARK